MCWFKKKKKEDRSKVKLEILHPEEPVNASQITANTDVNGIINMWLTGWKVPEKYWDHWRNAIVIQVYDSWPPDMLSAYIRPDTPAATWDAGGKRHLASLAKWLNPGVIAHEQAHNSYALLSGGDKSAFSKTYTPLKNTDPLIKYLYSINPYGLTNDIEGHAEIYRYLGETMPEALKRFYPKLM